MVKLVRDKIPIAIGTNKKFQFRKIESDEEFCKLLKLKLLEESQEVVGAESDSDLIEEIIDIMEVVDELIKFLGLNTKKIKELRERKKQNKGGFSKRVMMFSSR